MSASATGFLERFLHTLTTINASQVQSLAAENLWFTLLLCFGSGVLASLTPCVYPVIPITINIFGRAAHQDRRRKHGFSLRSFKMAVLYVAGMCLTYSLLGLISGVTGSLFGRLLQSAWVLAGLSLLFLVLSLGQLGLFKMTLPASWQNRLAKIGNARNGSGIFLMGIVSGLIVSPCVGPIITGILAFVFETSNAILGTLYFFSFSLGLGLLFLVIGGFSGLLSQLPRSGRWMARINYLLSLLLMVASAYYGSLWLKQVGILKKNVPIESSIQWLGSEAEAIKAARAKQLPILIDFTAQWCEACHEIDERFFSDAKIVEILSKNFVTVRVDVTAETDENATLLKKYGVVGLPSLVFISRDGRILDQPRVNGLLPVEQFLAMIQSVLITPQVNH